MESESRGPRGALVLGCIVVAAFVAKLVLAARYYGFLTGDDLEVVEAGAKYAFGLEYQPWSLRCLFHPLVLVAPLLKLSSVFLRGFHPLWIAWIGALPTIAASSANIGLTFRLAALFGLGRKTALLAALFYSTHWLPLGFGSMQYPRPISTMFFLIALVAVLESPVRWAFMGGVLIGAAFAVRFSEGVLALPYLLVVWLRSRRLAALGLAGTGVALGALLFAGATDLVTWGRPLASLSEFVRVMYLDRPPSFPHYDNPWYWYATSVLHWAGPVAVVLLAAAFAVRNTAVRLAMALLVLVVASYSLFAFKAYRYVQAGVPFLAILMAAGCSRLLAASGRPQRVAGWVMLALAPAWGVERTFSLLRDRSRDAVDAALFIRQLHPRRVLLEQAWAYGDRLILERDTQIADFEPRQPVHLTASLLDGVDVAAFYARDLSHDDFAVLRGSGFRTAARFAERPKTVVVFRHTGAHPRLNGP